MTETQHRLAAHARSILACPSGVSMAIEGEEYRVGDDQELALTDQHGTPRFVCRPGSPVDLAAIEHRSVVLTITSGLGPRGGPDRADTVTIAGRLDRASSEDCECCHEVRHVVTLRANFVLMSRPAAPGTPDRHSRILLEEFSSHSHQLNRGHLQRSIEHANDCHQDELRQAVAMSAGVRPADLVGVRLADLTSSGVEIQWVDITGAHRTVVTFPRTALDSDDLGELLRRGLHAEIC